jgi:hypothetical protein
MARSKIWDALVRAAGGAPSTPPPHDQMLRDLYGAGPRGGLNAAKAAKAFGKSERTIRRWAREGVPASSARSLERRHSRWRRESEAGRRAALGSAAAAMAQRGLAVAYKGKILISGADPRNTTSRTTSFTIAPDRASVLLDAAISGSRADLHAALEWAAEDAFSGSVQFVIDDIRFS